MMKEYRRTAAGIAAMMLTAGLTSCAGSAEQTTEATTEATTTTAVTVEINTETLAPEDAKKMDDVADMLRDEELENKTIKWFSFYDPFNATTSGNTKALSLELFERKYGGSIEYIPTTWNQRFTDLSTNILGGTGIDFIAGGDLDSFPKGVPNGQFDPFDSYIDWNDELWSSVKALNDQFELNGSHYIMCTQATANEVVFYNRKTIEENGFDDPAELLENGEWTLNKFREMLTEFVDPEAEHYGLDGWWCEKPILLSCGVSPVELKNGKVVSNLYDERLEKVMDYMYSLNQTGLVMDKGLFDWNVHPEFIAEGKELFYIQGMYGAEGAPEIWTKQFGDAEDVMFVPMPRDENADEYYLTAGLEAFMLCKGAANPVGTARFMECILAANMDENALEIADQKRRDDFGWTDEMIDMRHKVQDMTAEHPMYSIHTGCPTDLYDILDSGESGIRASFYGHEWPTVREEVGPVVDMLLDEFNATL